MGESPQVGPDEHVICALSGGVDSTVAATLVHKVVGDRLHCVFVDNGLLRYKVRRRKGARHISTLIGTAALVGSVQSSRSARRAGVCACAQEQERVMDTFNNHLHLPVTCIDHSAAMLERLAGLTEPEAKRKAIGAEFIEVFKTFRDNLEKSIGKRPKFLVQGTL